jgi:solute:Na+ symporter, SSS family
MSIIDWFITALPLLIVLAFGVYTHRYVKSVADFMSGGRVAGRYLLAIAGGELQAGAVVFVGAFEVISHAGFTVTWWSWLSIPTAILVSISGFVVYRYRETRVLTLAQFFEVRYSKAFRLFTGILGFGAGILNFGIIPAVGARCVSYFLGCPETISIFAIHVPTYVLFMALFLGTALFVALSGGVVSIMITNCIEGIISQVFYLIIIVALLSMFSWSQISEVLGHRQAGQSFLNPFDSGSIRDFNVWYTLMGMVVGIYGTMAWQNASGYNSASFSPHESRMGGILGRWREMGKAAVITLLGICALTFLHHPDFAGKAAIVSTALSRISDPHVQEQMEAPIAMSYFLPVGVKGVLCAIFLMGIFGGDSLHLHSWGSIFVQDVLVPLRRQPFEPRQHVRVLRLAICGVAIFAFLFGLLFQQTQYIYMWWQVTMAIYVGGAGSAIIGGLYWKKGSTAGAWAALITGSTLSVSGILAQQWDPHFPLNGTQVSFYAMIMAIVVYVTVSFLTCRKDFDLDRMLHRGKYAAIKAQIGEAILIPQRKVWLGRLIGLDENFTLADKWIACSLFGWSIFWCLVLIIGTAWNFIAPWSFAVWSTFWEVVGMGMPVVFSVVTGIWFTWGGLKGMREFFHRLRQEKINNLDDGTVINHQNLEELALEASRTLHQKKTANPPVIQSRL